MDCRLRNVRVTAVSAERGDAVTKRTEYEPTIKPLDDGSFGISRIEIDGDERVIHFHSAHPSTEDRDEELKALRANSDQ
jgi:hypothetical protein